jgi:hypothetical protein
LWGPKNEGYLGTLLGSGVGFTTVQIGLSEVQNPAQAEGIEGSVGGTMSGHGNKVLSFPNRIQATSSEDHIQEIREALRCVSAAMMRSQRQVEQINRILEQIESRDARGSGADPRDSAS